MKAVFIAFLAILLIDFTYGQKLTLFDRPNTIMLLSMPANEEEFFNIFKRKPGIGELGNIVTLLNQHEDLKNVYIIKKSSDLGIIMKYIMSKGNEDNYDEYLPRIGFTIIGHNDRGNFYFPDGTTMKLENIEKDLMGIPGMFLSCNAKKIWSYRG
ncbi:hypothetical protein [Chitinophaga ginsengisoli]|uniref:Uncharacterized protein n=1 Tax=Chitinophaga ginsengisoli TaxID=363837 RepID=A0A2P8G2Y5_9BACT|nr:hypothetical protein [Chitinophaga ginsengisoli]PSL28354.1 hypothetical protein CLV42_108275 [Chitinophaga ginsengisoli]